MKILISVMVMDITTGKEARVKNELDYLEKLLTQSMGFTLSRKTELDGAFDSTILSLYRTIDL